ncbi:thiamine diphosphokinase [Desulfospira joergensenii]|uniref:thiamine diphosphokinase n=1 Tax=Desulfospira joergensenii TaxID=53329 RepID=UPI0003B2E75C|nr:thiamine diphosphokinase [Desulfospira joergensenii]
MKCIIIAGGLFEPDPTRGGKLDRLVKKADLIIAADGGANHLRSLDITPHFIIGDLDSIHPETRNFYEKKKVEFIRYPSRKGNTDTDLCVDFSLEKGASDITLAGMTGQRLDHTLANIFLLRRMADLKVTARIIDGHNEIYLFTCSNPRGDSLELEGRPGEFLSVIPISERVEGVTLKGLEYPLDNHTLEFGSTLGISNCYKDRKAVISITNGSLIITKSTD